jgi:hypothetical protein
MTSPTRDYIHVRLEETTGRYNATVDAIGIRKACVLAVGPDVKDDRIRIERVILINRSGALALGDREYLVRESVDVVAVT